MTLPPRHGKSELCSAAFPAWYLGNFPDRRIILASYQDTFAMSWGRKTRDILEAFGPTTFGVRLRADVSAAAEWHVAGHRGGMTTAGVGGRITGMGANLFLIDDPVKNAEEALSLTMRDAAWEWYLSTVRTRLEPNASIVVVMTRWHPDDLVGRLVSRSPVPWTHIRIPAIAEAGDPIGRPVGAALWPQRYDEAALADLRAELGHRWWSALFQQTPATDVVGALWTQKSIDDNRAPVDSNGEYVRPEMARILVGVDPAGGAKETNDETGIVVCGIDRARQFWVLEDCSGRMTATDWARRALAALRQWKADKIVAEKNFGGDMVDRVLRAIEPNVPVELVHASRGKEQRAEPISTLYEQEKVHHFGVFPELEAQMTSWVRGSGSSPDRMDALVWALTKLKEGGSAVSFLDQLVNRTEPTVGVAPWSPQAPR